MQQQSDLVVGVPRFSVAERDRRWRRTRDAMREAGIDVIFVPPNTGLWDHFQANVRYLTGIGGNCAQAAAIFPVEGEVTAVTNPDVDIRFWLARQDWVSDIRMIGTAWGYAGSAIERMRELGLDRARVGITGMEGNTRFPEGITSHGIYLQVREAFPLAEIVNANLLMERVRFVKSEEEIDFLRQADALVEQALQVLAREARPGIPENQVYARMLASMVEGGSEIPTMILWAAGWPQPPSNHYMPSWRKLCAGDMIMTEAEARWAGYVAQNTQPLFLGKAPDDYRAMFDLQQDTMLRCYEMLRPGRTLGEIADMISSRSTDEYHCLVAIHGRGLGDDSPMAVYAPRTPLMRDWPIEENSTFIVKPIVRTPDNGKRIYWGDTVVATTTGARRLGTRKPEIMELT